MTIAVQDKSGKTISLFTASGECDLTFRACPRCQVLVEWDWQPGAFFPHDEMFMPTASHRKKCSV